MTLIWIADILFTMQHKPTNITTIVIRAAELSAEELETLWLAAVADASIYKRPETPGYKPRPTVSRVATQIFREGLRHWRKEILA